MKTICRNLDAGFLLEDLETRQLLTITIVNPVSDLSINRGAPAGVISLANRYTDVSVSSVVRFTTNSGTLDIALFGGAAPNTVANFLTYVNAGSYNNTIFHREQVAASQGIGILQGGSFRVPTANYTTFPPGVAQTPQAIPTNPAINLENPTGNVRGTIAMARTNQLNSATSSFFFNTTNNTAILDDATPEIPDSGYAVFGQLLPGSLATLDALTAFQDTNFSEDFGPAFADMPLRKAPGNQGFVEFPIAPSDYLTITNASVLNGVFGEISVTSANPNLLTASVNGGNLILTPVGNGLGTVTITVRITSFDGTFVEDTFDVTVTNPPPVVGGGQGQSVAQGRSMLVSAYGVRDTDAGGGAVGSVAFYHDTNDDGLLDENDELLGFDNSATGGWNLRFDTTNFEVGANRIIIVVTDTENATGTASLIVNIRPPVPTGTVPGETNAGGGNVPIVISNLPSSDTIRRVSIFIDSDNNGQLNPLTDRLIGHATYDPLTTDWLFTVSGSELQTGANRFFIRTTDGYGSLGGLAAGIINYGV